MKKIDLYRLIDVGKYYETDYQVNDFPMLSLNEILQNIVDNLYLLSDSAIEIFELSKFITELKDIRKNDIEKFLLIMHENIKKEIEYYIHLKLDMDKFITTFLFSSSETLQLNKNISFFTNIFNNSQKYVSYDIFNYRFNTSIPEIVEYIRKFFILHSIERNMFTGSRIRKNYKSFRKYSENICKCINERLDNIIKQ